MAASGMLCQDHPALSDVVVAEQQAELHEAFRTHNPTSYYNVLPHSDSSVRLVFYNGYTDAVVYDKAFDVVHIPEGLVDDSGIEAPTFAWGGLPDGEGETRAPADNGDLTTQDMLSMASAEDTNRMEGRASRSGQLCIVGAGCVTQGCQACRAGGLCRWQKLCRRY